MSATGQGGVSVIAGQSHGQLSPVTIPASGFLTFTHNVGRFAFSVLVTDGGANYGQVLTSADDMFVTQPDANTVVVSNNSGDNKPVFISCRWEEPTPELDLISASDPRIEIEQPR
jgi:hypothetical protein